MLQHRFLKCLSFLHWTAFVHLSKITWAYLHTSVSGFSIPFQCSLCLSLHQDHPVLFTRGMYYNTMCWNWVDWFFPLYSSISHIVLTILYPLPFHINLKIILSIAIKNCWNFGKTCVNPIYKLEGKLTSFLCWVFQTMHTVCLFLYLDLWFLSTVFCSFQHTSPVHVVFPSSRVIINGNVFLILVASIDIIDFCVFIYYCVCILQHCPTY